MLQDQQAKEKDAQRRRLQSDILIIDSDLKKIERRIVDIDFEKRRLMRDMARINSELEDKAKELEKSKKDKFYVESQLAVLRKKMKAI